MKLTILATSDTHGFIPPTNFVELAENKPYGLEKASSVISQYKAEHPDEIVVTVDNGDFLEGSPLAYFTAKRAQPLQRMAFTDAYNQVNYDIGTIGNHEFDFGLDYLETAMANSNRQFLCANIVDDEENPLIGEPYQIIQRAGIKIGILGLTTTSARKWKNINQLNNFHLLSAVKTAQRYVPYLQKHADVVVVVYHGGFERDTSGTWTDITPGENEGYALLEQVPGIDALVTGHQHRKLAGELFGVPCIQPGHRGEFVGKISLELEKQTSFILENSAELLPCTDVDIDSNVAASIQPLKHTLEEWLDQPLANIVGDLTFSDPNAVRKSETAFIEFIQKVQMAAMHTDISATALYNNEAHGFENPITMRNVITNYVYPNSLAAVKVTGADLRAALEVSAQYFSLNDAGEVIVNPRFLFPKHRFYNYDMYEGVDYILDISKPVGQRVTELKYQGTDLMDDTILEIALNKYRATGGGHYPMFDESKIVRSDTTIMSQLIFEYLKANPVVTATNNHNFKVIGKQKE